MDRPNHRVLLFRVTWLLYASLCLGIASSAQEIDERLQFSTGVARTIDLSAGDTVEIEVGIESPSQLPPNGRLAVHWTGPREQDGWRKVLHALDPDVYVLYRAQVPGEYQLKLAPIEDEEAQFNRPRWRETGIVAQTLTFPRHTPWPTEHRVALRTVVRSVSLGTTSQPVLLEMEPNNHLERAQPIDLPILDGSAGDVAIQITGSADDLEYFDNGEYGESGDDWFRLEFRGEQPRLLTVNLMPTDPLVAARVRCYSADGQEYLDGKHLNEAAHEQVEEHRTAIVRNLQPGATYYLRVEANSPGYDLDLRIRRPAPFTDPRDAVRLAMYDHVAQVSAWIMNRPRGNSLDRRIRDTGSLYGSNCMSCHTQSGVWGPAVPIAFGYRLENPLHYRLLLNTMYESLRPTNALKDAANNTSLAPHDLGDGPAGTRVAGHAVCAAEAVIRPRKLHSMQQIRTANYVLQTSDPSGVNAAGNGSNVGQAVVIHYAGEILRRAWDQTHDVRYLEGLTARADAMLEVSPKFLDDLAHRILFFRRVFPAEQAAADDDVNKDSDLGDRIDAQLEQDLAAVRRSQRSDGAWGFAPGSVDDQSDPAPTALAIDAMLAMGADRNDKAVQQGVEALLAMQHPYGLWNRSARTGFVTTSYVMNTLARLFPDDSTQLEQESLTTSPDASLLDTVAAFRQLAHGMPGSDVSSQQPVTARREQLEAGVRHRHPPVRYWAMMALSNDPSDASVKLLIDGLGDPVKMVREAARWSLRQVLLDDNGWSSALAIGRNGSDLQREQLAATLVMRADTVMPASSLDLNAMAELLSHMMADDVSPAVRAWATRAAWNWWVWNPPVRPRLNQGFLRLLETPEPSLLAENAKRYQMQALLIVNGNRSAANYDNPYTELADLYRAIRLRLMTEDEGAARIGQRLTRIAATYYNASYGSNGNGQLGYATPDSSAAIGTAVVRFWNQAEQAADLPGVQLAIEAAANIIDESVQQKLLHYSIKGPESLRSIATSSLSDPRAVLLPTSPEFVVPLMERILANARTEEGRRLISRTTVRQLSLARWDMPMSEGRQREFFQMMIPALDDSQDDSQDETQRFLAEQLGRVLANNPDFRTEVLLALIPKSFRNPIEELYWLPSAGWMLTYDTPVPEVGQSAFPVNRPELRQAALDLYLRHLSPDADRRLREQAIAMMYQPALYSHPDVIAAAGRLDLGSFRNFLPETFARELEQAVAEDPREQKLRLTPERLRNVAYFRDFVIPELSRVKREDGESCFTCHGGGKIPSMSLAAADRRTRYISPEDVWTNYRTLLDRINPTDIESSKVLRKPLNIQSGEEDGHQGGMRYKPGDPGHEILRRWVEDAARLD